MISPLLGTLFASATLSICGSETLGRTALSWAHLWEDAEPAIPVETHFPGSDLSLGSLSGGSCRVALLSREPPVRVPAGLNLRQVGWDEVVFFVHRSSPLRSVTLGQLQQILSGRLTGWNLYGRNELSGTHDWVRTHVLGSGRFAPDMHLLPGPQGVVHAVSTDPRGIGYASLAALHGEVRVLALRRNDGTPLHLRRPLFLARRRNDSEAARFELLALSSAGQEALRRSGLSPAGAP